MPQKTEAAYIVRKRGTVSMVGLNSAPTHPNCDHPPRRLSNTEYQTTIQKLFEIHDFKLPVGFPPDAKYHGFNNIASGLTISPPLMESLSECRFSIGRHYTHLRGKLRKSKLWSWAR